MHADNEDAGKRSDLERVQELFEFLQGTVPSEYTIPDAEVSHLTDDQAWTVIWYLGNQYYRIPDYIERCGECGDLFDTRSEGGHDEDGPPYHFCEPCYDQHTIEKETTTDNGD